MATKLQTTKVVALVLLLIFILVEIGFMLGDYSRGQFDKELDAAIHKPSAKPGEPSPKSNDHRIVHMSDGSYRIQYYWAFPGWEDMCESYKTPARAKEVLAYIEHPPYAATVVEIVK